MTIDKTILFAGLSTLVLGGCTASHDGSSATEKSSGEAGYNKPGASMQVKTTYDGKSNPGEVERFTVSVIDGYAKGTMNVEFVAPSGMQIYTPTEYKFSMASSEPHEMPVEIMVEQEGRYYLNVYMKADLGNGKIIPATRSIGIYVGQAAQSKDYEDPNLKITPTGEAVIEMQGEETIKPNE